MTNALAKGFLLFACFFFYSESVIYAQPKQYLEVSRTLDGAKILDSANIRIAYSLVFIADSSKPSEKWNDQKILLISNSTQHFYSYYSRLVDSAHTIDSKGMKSFKILQLPAGVCAERYDIYRNYPVGKQTTIENISNFQMFVYKEDLKAPIWSIAEDTMTIFNYLCHKAVCFYYGRTWEAWFALDIPLSAGPWKLYGLPGLILKANDDRQHYVFECNGIEMLKRSEPILIYGSAHKAASDMGHNGTRDGYLKARLQFYDNYVNYLLSVGCNVNIIDHSGNIIEFIETPNKKFAERNVSWGMKVSVYERNRKIPYNPIELE
jgi:GLPGLI family protein